MAPVPAALTETFLFSFNKVTDIDVSVLRDQDLKSPPGLFIYARKSNVRVVDFLISKLDQLNNPGSEVSPGKGGNLGGFKYCKR